MKVRVISKKGSSAIILCKDKDAVLQAYVVDSALIKGRVGKEMEIEDSILDTATPYGIDWGVVFPEGISINAEDIQDFMYSHGIVTIGDLKRNPTSIAEALNELIRSQSAKIYNLVKITMEDYHDNLQL